MKYVLAFLALVLPGLAFADTWIDFSVSSYHFDRSVDHQERNWGIGLEQSITKEVNFVIGSYNNSEYLRSHYIGISYLPLQYNGVKLGFVAGMVDGYPNLQNGHYGPLAAPLLSYEYGKVGFNIIVIPPVDKTIGVIGMQIKFKVW